MELIIKRNDDIITIRFNKEVITLHTKPEDAEKNSEWKTSSINAFLIKLAAQIPKGEEITVKVEPKDEDDEITKHIGDLFTTFADSYNKNLSVTK